MLKVGEEKENQENDAAELRFFGDLKNMWETHLCLPQLLLNDFSIAHVFSFW